LSVQNKMEEDQPVVTPSQPTDDGDGDGIPDTIDAAVHSLEDYEVSGSTERPPGNLVARIMFFVEELDIPERSEAKELQKLFVALEPKNAADIGDMIARLKRLLDVYKHHEKDTSSVVDMDDVPIDVLLDHIDIIPLLEALDQFVVFDRHSEKRFVSSSLIPWLHSVNEKFRPNHPLAGKEAVLILRNLEQNEEFNTQVMFRNSFREFLENKIFVQGLVRTVDLHILSQQHTEAEIQQTRLAQIAYEISRKKSYKPRLVKRLVESGIDLEQFISDIKLNWFELHHEYFADSPMYKRLLTDIGDAKHAAQPQATPSKPPPKKTVY